MEMRTEKCMTVHILAIYSHNMTMETIKTQNNLVYVIVLLHGLLHMSVYSGTSLISVAASTFLHFSKICSLNML